MILDACCGGKMWYKGLHLNFAEEELVFMDIREGVFEDKWGKTVVEPTKKGSIINIPWDDNSFTMILFDPPHMRAGAKGIMIRTYGSWDHEEFIRSIYHANKEFYRVLKPGGVVFAKILELQQRRRNPYKWNRPAKLIEQFTNFKLLLDITYPSQGQGRDTCKTHIMLFIGKPK